jgi:hypothetical protein
MSPAELLSTDDHIRACAVCAERFRAEARPLKASLILQANIEAAEQEHLLYEEVEAYIDGEISGEDRELVELHLVECSQCSSQVATARGVEVYANAGKASGSRVHFQDKMAILFRAPAYRSAIWITAALMVGSLLLWLMTTSLRSEVNALRARISQLDEANRALEKQLSEVSELQSRLAELERENATLRLQTGAPGSAILWSLDDGGEQISLDKDGNLRGLESLPASYRENVRTVLIKQRVKLPADLARLRGKPEKLMGEKGDPSFAVLNPLGTVVLTDRPTLRWASLNGASGYVATVYNSEFEEVVTSPLLTQTEWQVSRSLERGRFYAWQVRAIKDGKEIKAPALGEPEAKFKVLDQRKLMELERARQSYGNSRLTLGILYGSAGLLEDAEREFQSLLGSNPDSQVARKLLESVKLPRR